jgi:hypothetical protein
MQALDAVLAPYESVAASDGKDGGVSAGGALNRYCTGAAAALRYMLPHLHPQVLPQMKRSCFAMTCST